MKKVGSNRVSLKTIAAEARLSVSTVSQILNDKSNNFSSEINKQKVRQIAQKLGYRTNFGYRLMQGQKTHTVAIMLSEAYMNAEEHLNELIIKLMNKFNQLDYSVYSMNFTHSVEDNLDKVRELISRGVEHFVLIGEPVGCFEIEQEIEQRERSLVCYGRGLKRIIHVDSIAGALGIFHFFSNENRDFRFVCPLNHAVKDNTRLIALQQLFPELTFEQIIERYVVTTKAINFESANYPAHLSDLGWEGASKTVKTLPQVNAIFFMTDYMAIGGANFLTLNGFEVGKDVLVAGFNNVPAVTLYPFPISSVEHDLDKVVDLLVEESLLTTACKHTIKPIIHIRTLKREKCKEYA